MTQIGSTEQQLEAAGRSAAAKLQSFHEGLTPEERQAIDLALRQLGAQVAEATGDTTGYATAMLGMGLFARLAAELYLYQKWAEGYQSQQR